MRTTALPRTTFPCFTTWWTVLLIGAFVDQVSAQPATTLPKLDATLASSSAASEAERELQYAALSRDVEAMNREFGIVKRVVKLVSPTVVHIEARVTAPFAGRRLEIEEAGSGVVVRFGPRHYVLTNRHVISQSTESNISIQLSDGRIIRPTEKWDDEETDVAVMAIEASRLVPAKLGDSDALEIGDFVLAVGSPFGLSQSVTRGIVSAKGRYDLALGDGELRWMNFIQTDAAINPGNSGGPLLNLRGEVVGLNTAIASSSGGNEGIGFTIPINIVVNIAQELVMDRLPPRGFLGVELDDHVDDELALALRRIGQIGTRVTNVTPDSPAERAELKVGDVVLVYDGVRIEDLKHLRNLVKLTNISEEVELIIFRDGKPRRSLVTIGDWREYNEEQP